MKADNVWLNSGRKLGILTSVMFFAFLTSANADNKVAPTKAPDIEEVKANAKQYVGSLKTLLQKKMSEDGPAGALDVCGSEGARIGGEITRKTGWSVRRITNQARNPLAMPDAYESKMLDQFSEKIADEPDTTSLVKYEVVEENGAKYARFMKGIRMEAVCLTCHGDKAAMGEVGDKIDALYPHDKARDYKVGDLRGALSIKIKLN